MKEDIVKEGAKGDECRTCLAITIKSVRGKQRRRLSLKLQPNGVMFVHLHSQFSACVYDQK